MRWVLLIQTDKKVSQKFYQYTNINRYLGIRMKKCHTFGCINFNKVVDDSNVICPSCGSQLIRTEGPPEGSRPAAGLIGGVLLGWAVGGPAGALLGGFLGGIFGASVEDEERRKKELDDLW